jgi:anti-sigma-K factor RskA
VNIKEYILSGIVESYVLGLASAEERAEFENLCLQHPELVAARNNFELALEQQLLNQALVPATEVKEKVISAIQHQPSVNQTKIITMESANTNRSSSTLRWVAAASIILLLVCAYFAYDFYEKNQALESKLAQTGGSAGEIETKQKYLDSLQERLKKLEMVDDPNVAVVNLKGTEKAPKSSASVYWDSTSADVYLVAKNMPKLANDQQYQLWALIGGQPKDLGLFDVGDDGKIILKMTNTEKADAFAITIETRGNNTGKPNLEQLQTMGKASL